MSYLEPSDFTGVCRVARTDKIDELIQIYIDRYEEFYIRRLLGVELGDLLIIALGMPSQEPRFVILEDPFSLQDEDTCGGGIHESRGLQDALVALVFYHYVQDTQVKAEQQGMAMGDMETSRNTGVRGALRKGERAWNEALGTLEAIQWYCCKYDPEEYPEYRGVKFSAQYSSLS
jgi:hypothetical protein